MIIPGHQQFIITITINAAPVKQVMQICGEVRVETVIQQQTPLPKEVVKVQ